MKCIKELYQIMRMRVSMRVRESEREQRQKKRERELRKGILGNVVKRSEGFESLDWGDFF